jgi:hypothetical protein
LDQLDKTVLRSATAVEQLLANHSFSPRGASSSRGLIGSASVNGSSGEEESLPDLPYFSINQNGHDIYHGPSSLLSLLTTATNSWLDHLKEGRSHGMQTGGSLKRNLDSTLNEDFSDFVRQKFQDAFQKATANDMLDLSNDGQTMVLPPRNLLDALAGPFFEHINHILPVLTKDSFTEAVNRIYGSQPAKIDVPWGLIFNNIILSTLPIHSGLSSGHGGDSGGRMKMVADLTRPFILNARRALARFDLLLSPRLENVQALISFVSL